jgi:hypothetical protein
MPNKVFCPKCKELGLKSRVYPGAAMSTLLASTPYYDENVKYHNNDPNTHTKSYSCNNGHKWVESWGGWCSVNVEAEHD